MAEGDIDVVLDSLIFESTRCYESQIIHITDDIYAIVYKGDGLDGWLCTVSIDAAGNIGAAVIDSYEFDTDKGYFPRIIHISGTVYALCYTGTDLDGFLRTINIEANGNIGAGPIDTFEYETVYSQPQSIIHIAGRVYAIAYGYTATAGRVTTVTINADGSIDSPVIEKVTYLPTPFLEPEIIHVTGNIYAIVYKGTSNHGFVLTISIDIDGDIGGAIIDTFEFDTGFCEEPWIVHVSGETFAIVYKGPDSDGWLKTVSIDASGNIGASALDSWEFDADQGSTPHIIPVSGNAFSIVYKDAAGDGWIKTVTIEANGTIGGAAIDSFEFDNVKCERPFIVHVGGDVYAISYIDTNDEGKLRTIGIETLFPAPMLHLPLMGIG